MTRTPIITMLAVATALAGCNKQSHTIVTGGSPDYDSNNVAANAPVALPPSITATKTYRCDDNNVVTVDWLSDNKSANIRVGKSLSPIQVTAAKPGDPMTAPGGYSLSGSGSAGSARIAVPGHPAQSCNS